MSAFKITAEQFSAFVAKGSCVVLFSASWCAPCKEMSPIFNTLADELHAVAVFGVVDVAVSPTVAQMYGIKTVPTLAVFREGKLISTIAGVRLVKDLKDMIVKELEKF